MRVQKPEITSVDEGLSQDESREALNRVLASKYFVNAPMKQKFLITICDFQLSGRGEELNEFLIGHEVFGRDNLYNPATDPIVRVSAHGVRYKLESYYQKEGAGDKVRIELPVGKYTPRFVKNTRQIAAVDNAGVETDQIFEIDDSEKLDTSPVRKNLWPLFVILPLLLIIAWLGYSNYQFRSREDSNNAGDSTGIYKTFWGGLLENESPTLIVLSNPAVFRFVNAADPETIINKSIPLTDEQTEEVYNKLLNKNLLKITPSSRLTLTSNIYTGLGEAMGLHNLTGVFRTINKEIQVKQSRTVSAEDLKNHNVIILGTVWVNDWSAKLPLAEDFIYTDMVTIRNLKPRNGEKTEYRAVFDNQTGEIVEDYALITVSQNISGNEWFMLVGGLHSEGTGAAAEYLTNPWHLTDLHRKIEAAGRPRYYQVLLKVSVENAIPTTITPVAIHPLKSAKQ